MKAIPVSGGLFARVDDVKYELVAEYTWYRFVSPHGLVYARRHWQEEGRRRGQFMHSLVTGFRKTDHIDHDGLNNQQFNLRDGSGGVNERNARSFRGSSQFKGVCWSKRRGIWTAQICANRKIKYLGSFEDEELAARAYDSAAVLLHGASACLNFPEVPDARPQP